MNPNSVGRTELQVRRSYVDGPVGQIHLRECGDGDPVLLLHQSPLSSIMFMLVLPLLARSGLRGIALDTPGYGLSDPPASPPSMEVYAEAPLAVLDALGLERAHLVGQHTGASIAACFAARRPERVNRLVLNGVPLLTDDERANFRKLDLRPPALRADGEHLLQVWRMRVSMTPGWTDLAWMHRFTVDMLLAGADSAWATGAVLSYDLEADISKISAPTLLFSNTGDVLHAATLRTAALRPAMSVATLDGGTQDITIEQPRAWSETVSRFLSMSREA